MSLLGRVVMLNATVFVAGIVVLAVTPAPVTFPVTVTGAVVLVAGLVAILLANLLLVRMTFEPLGRLRNLMRRVDLLRPGERLPVEGPAEVRELVAVFNEMLDRLEHERRESSLRALAAEEDERKRVSHELHDEIGQVLTAVLLLLEGLAERVPSELRDDLRDAQEAARGSLEDVRRVARRLRPEALDDLGLVSALSALTASFTSQTGIRVERRIERQFPRLDPDVELVLYRVAQESLTNVARHARATRVDLGLQSNGSAVTLRVADDGVGMYVDAPGHGIRGMRERALLVGARLSIANRPTGGVEVRLEVPA